MKGVITGATGYIGSNLLRLLLSQSWDLYIITQAEFGYDNIEDIKQKVHVIEYNGEIENLISIFKEIKPDVVFHLAAAIILDYKPSQIATLIQSNIQFGTEILEAMKNSNTRLFINTGTFWQNFESEHYNPVDLYAATKEAFEKIIQYYVEAHSFQSITLRLFDVYGENDIRPKLLNRLCSIAGTNDQIDVSPGEQFLDMIYITDVCKAFLKAYELLSVNNKISYKVYGVFSNHRTRLKDLILMLEDILGKKINVNFGAKPYKVREVMYPASHYEKLPNWEPQVSLSEGLRKFKK